MVANPKDFHNTRTAHRTQGKKRQRRDFRDILAASTMILSSIGYSHRHRAFIHAVQSVSSLDGSPVSRTHAQIARQMEKATDRNEPLRKFGINSQPQMKPCERTITRELNYLEGFQRKTGIIIFEVKRGGGEKHEATTYVDNLTAVAQWLMRETRDELDRMQTAPGKNKNPGLAMEKHLDRAIELLPRREPDKDEPDEEPVVDVDGRVRKRISQAAIKVAECVQLYLSNGRDPQKVLEMAAEEIRKRADAVAEKRWASIKFEASGVTVCHPSESVSKEESKFAESNALHFSTKLEFALDAASRFRLPVFPCHYPLPNGCSCKRKDCANIGKHPMISGWQKKATTDPEQIKAWWKRWPQANIGTPTGATQVLDIDPRHNGDSSLSDLIDMRGELPETLAVSTGGGGIHFFFNYPNHEQEPIRNSSGKLGEGIDTRGKGGLVILPGSTHTSGKSYQWINDCQMARLPDWLKLALTERQEIRRGATVTNIKTRAALSSDENIPDGKRDETLFRRVACSMRAKGAEFSEIYQKLSDVNASQCSPPLEDHQVQKVAKSACKYPAGSATHISQRKTVATADVEVLTL